MRGVEPWMVGSLGCWFGTWELLWLRWIESRGWEEEEPRCLTDAFPAKIIEVNKNSKRRENPL